jgi:hypothetical protein
MYMMWASYVACYGVERDVMGMISSEGVKDDRKFVMHIYVRFANEVENQICPEIRF